MADLVWARFGDTPNYIELFFGSGAVMLARPHAAKTETVNDANAFLSNFWRALQADPDAVARYADWPVNECDLFARHQWLVTTGAGIVEQIKADPEWFDAKIAGFWVWGACAWIGSGWCAGQSSWGADSASVSNQIPHLRSVGMGVHQKSVATAGLYDYLHELSERLRRVRVCCGDWSRIMGPSVTVVHGMTAVFLDPPYSESERAEVYATETPGVAVDVRDWCLANGNDPLLRTALCGYAGEGHDLLEAAGWECVAWKASGGYGNIGKGRGADNAKRERIWFSPNCLKPGLFGDSDDFAETMTGPQSTFATARNEAAEAVTA